MIPNHFAILPIFSPPLPVYTSNLECKSTVGVKPHAAQLSNNLKVMAPVKTGFLYQSYYKESVDMRSAIY